MTSLKDLFKRFLRERKEYKNITPKTERSYEKAFSMFSKRLPEVTETTHLLMAFEILPSLTSP